MLIIFCVMIFSTKVQAEIKTFEGVGSYPITDEKTHGEVKELAKKEAIRDALEKAGLQFFRKRK